MIAVNAVSLKLERGRIAGLIGPNGSGKTTLFNLVTGVYKPDGGRIHFDGRDITGWPPHRIFKAGMARSFQSPRLFYKMTLLDNMVFAARGQVGDSVLRSLLTRASVLRQEREIADRALEVLDTLGLGEYRDRYPSELSGGQLKLLELGRALMAVPKLLLLDEPSAGVSPVLVPEIFKVIIKAKKDQKLTVFVIEHRLYLVADYMEWVYVMNNGRIFMEGQPKEVLESEELIRIYTGVG